MENNYEKSNYKNNRCGGDNRWCAYCDALCGFIHSNSDIC